MKSHLSLRQFQVVDKAFHSYRHELMPRNPWKKNSMDAATRPPNAPDNRLPEYRMAVLNASSFFVYQDESRNSAPGKKGLVQSISAWTDGVKW